MTTFALILDPTVDTHAVPVQGALGRIFGVKEATSENIVQSAPIVLIDDLARSEAAALLLALRGIETAGGMVRVTTGAADELPRINWPRTPQILKQDISRIVDEYRMQLSGSTTLLQLLETMLDERLGITRTAARSEAAAAVAEAMPDPTANLVPQAPTPAVATAGPDTADHRQVFEESELGEITPFANKSISSSSPAAAPNLLAEDADILSRMEEIFPDDGEIIPNNREITSILDRLLPDDEKSPLQQEKLSSPSTSGTHPVNGSSGESFSVFLARISDDNRRQKAIPLLQDLAGLDEAAAQTLSKKVIIPVLKNVSKDAAEDAKHRFAEIGILARIKGG